MNAYPTRNVGRPRFLFKWLMIRDPLKFSQFDTWVDKGDYPQGKEYCPIGNDFSLWPNHGSCWCVGHHSEMYTKYHKSHLWAEIRPWKQNTLVWRGVLTILKQQTFPMHSPPLNKTFSECVNQHKTEASVFGTSEIVQVLGSTRGSSSFQGRQRFRGSG